MTPSDIARLGGLAYRSRRRPRQPGQRFILELCGEDRRQLERLADASRVNLSEMVRRLIRGASTEVLV